MLRVAYIVPLNKGLGIPSFIYREIEALRGLGLELVICPFIHNSGIYMPKKEWNVIHYTAPTIMRHLVSITPEKILSFLHGIGHASLPHALIASYLSDRLMDMNVDLIHAHFGDHQYFVGYYIKKMTSLPLSVTVHAYEIYARNPFVSLTRQTISSADLVVTVSEFNRRVLIDMGVPDGKIRVIRLFVDLERFRPFPGTLGTDRRVKVLAVGRFVPKKGYDVLLKAMKHCDSDRIHFWIVGDGPLPVRRLARDMGLSDLITFFGNVTEEELLNLYNSCDIFCLPSKTDFVSKRGAVTLVDREGLPVSILEAMAFEKPVISTTHAGIPEALDQILVPPNDHRALAEAINMLSSDPDLRKELGSRNRRIVEERFSVRNVRELMSCFEEMVTAI